MKRYSLRFNVQVVKVNCLEISKGSYFAQIRKKMRFTYIENEEVQLNSYCEVILDDEKNYLHVGFSDKSL